VMTGLWLHADRMRLQAEANFTDAVRERNEARRNLEAAVEEFKRAELHRADCYLAVDRYFTRVSEERLLHQPDMEGLRKELLPSALDFYNRFAALPGPNPRFERLPALANAGHRFDAERRRPYAPLPPLTPQLQPN